MLGAQSTGAFKATQEGLATVFETVAVVGLTVKDTLVGVGREIGAIAAQAAALARLDFKGFSTIGDMAKEDAKQARAEWESAVNAILTARQRVADAPPMTAAADAAGSKATVVDLNSIATAALNATKSYQSKAEQMAEVRAQGDKLRGALKQLEAGEKGASQEADQLRERLKGVDERLASMAKSGNSGANGIKATDGAIKSLLKSLEARTAAQRLEIAQGDKLTESQRARIQLESILGDAKTKASKSQIAYAQGLLQEAEANEAWLKNTSEVDKALADMQKAREQSLRSVQDSVRKLVEEAEATAYAEQQNISLAEAVERLALARAENAYQQAVERGEGQQTLDYLRQEIAARKELVTATAQKGVKESNKKAAEQAARDWEKVSQTIGDTLADYIMGGGKDAATYLKRLFSTLVLQPVVQYGTNALMGAVGLGGASAQATGLGNAGQFLSLGKNAYGLFGGGMSAANSVGTGIANLTGTGIDGLLATNGAYGTASGVQGAAGSAFSGAMAYTGYAAAVAYGMKMAGDAFDEGYRLTHKNWIAGHAATGGIAPLSLSMDTSLLSKLGISERTANVLTGASLWAKGLSAIGISQSTPHTGAGAIYQNGSLQEGAGIYNQASFGMGIADEYAATAQASVSSIAAQAGNTLDAVAKLFNQQAGYSVATAFADDRSKDGAWGSLKIADAVGNVLLDWEQARQSKWAPKEFSDGEAGYNEYLSAVQADVLKAIHGMNLPTWAKDMFAAAEGAEGLQVALQSVDVTFAQLDQLRKNMPMFAGMSDDMASSLLKAYGGIDALSASAGVFYEKFYSQEERMEAAMNQIAEIVGIDPRLGDEAKAAFKKATEDAMAGGQAGIAGALMNMSQAFADAADYAAQAAKDAAKSAEDAAKAAQDAAQDAYDSAVDGAWRNLEAAVGRETAYWQGIASASQEAISSLSSTLNLLTSNARDLYGTVDSTQQMLAVQGMLYVENALAAVRGGADVAGFDGLSDAISAARGGISSGVYATQFEKDRDALVLAGQLSALGELTDSQLSIEERQLRAAQSQIDQLDQTLSYWQQQIDGTTGVIDATLSVGAAVQALAAMLAPKTAVAGVDMSAAQSVSGAALYADVAAYGAKNGSDAYYFIAGVNDVASKMESYQDIAGIMGWTLDQATQHVSGHGVDYWNAVDAASKAGAVVNASDSLEEIMRKAGVPGYASGGLHAGGLRIVGERGWEVEATGPSRVWNQQQLATALGGGAGDTGRLERLVEDLTTEVRRLQSIVDEGNRSNAQLLDITDQKSEGGNADRVHITNVQELAVAIKEVIA